MEHNEFERRPKNINLILKSVVSEKENGHQDINPSFVKH